MITHTTFLKLHSARSQYDPQYPFAPWLFTICRTALTDQLRKTARVLESADEEAVAQALAEEHKPAAETPDLSKLPSMQRQAIELRYGSDLPFEEIARRLETTPSNVRQVVSRAIRRLKRKS